MGNSAVFRSYDLFRRIKLRKVLGGRTRRGNSSVRNTKISSRLLSKFSENSTVSDALYSITVLICFGRSKSASLVEAVNVCQIVDIRLLRNNRNVFSVNRHLETATEYNLLFSLPKITASQYSLSRAISDHLTIRSSCVPGCNVVAEGGQSWCGTRNLKAFKKKNEPNKQDSQTK